MAKNTNAIMTPQIASLCNVAGRREGAAAGAAWAGAGRGHRGRGE